MSSLFQIGLNVSWSADHPCNSRNRQLTFLETIFMNFTYRSTPDSLTKRPASKNPAKITSCLSMKPLLPRIMLPRPKVNFELNFSRYFVLGFSKCHVIKISKIFGDFVPRDTAFPRVFSRRSAILKIVEEKALGTRLFKHLKGSWVSCRKTSKVLLRSL